MVDWKLDWSRSAPTLAGSRRTRTRNDRARTSSQAPHPLSQESRPSNTTQSLLRTAARIAPRPSHTRGRSKRKKRAQRHHGPGPLGINAHGRLRTVRPSAALSRHCVRLACIATEARPMPTKAKSWNAPMSEADAQAINASATNNNKPLITKSSVAGSGLGWAADATFERASADFPTQFQPGRKARGATRGKQ